MCALHAAKNAILTLHRPYYAAAFLLVVAGYYGTATYRHRYVVFYTVYLVLEIFSNVVYFIAYYVPFTLVSVRRRRAPPPFEPSALGVERFLARRGARARAERGRRPRFVCRRGGKLKA